MGIKKVIAKRANKIIYNKFRLNDDMLNIVYSFLSDQYLNEKEKKKYLIYKMNDLLKQKLKYFIYPTNDFNNNYCRAYDLYSISLDHFFEKFICQCLLVNQYNMSYIPNEGRYRVTIINNKYEVNIKTIFDIDEFTNDSIKAMRTVLYRLRYLDKNGDVYYTSYSLKKNNNKRLFYFNISFIVTLDESDSKEINYILRNKINNKKIYNIRNNNPLGQNNKKIIERFKLIENTFMNKICIALDNNIKSMKI